MLKCSTKCIYKVRRLIVFVKKILVNKGIAKLLDYSLKNMLGKYMQNN